MSLLPSFDSVIRSYKSIEPVLKKYLPKGETESFGEQLLKKAANMQPRIMVYGIYNAGKSTLLNALIGREDAPVSDRPETTAVTPYNWNGYILLDTPGIDAPEQDEITARKEIDRSDVVLFVVSTGGAVDEAKTWDEVVVLINRGRQVMMVLNNKQGLEPDSQAYQRVADKFRINLQMAAAKAGISNIPLPPISLVNAKSALKGRLENKPALIEHSGILKLELTLIDFLQQCDSSTVFNTVRNDLIEKINNAELALENIVGSSDSKELIKCNQIINKERTNLATLLNEELDTLLIDASNKIVRLVEQSSGNNEQVEAEISMVAESLNEQLRIKIDEELPRIDRSLKDIGKELLEARLEATKVHGVTLPTTGGTGIKDLSIIEQAAKDWTKKISVNPELIKQGTVFALKQGKELLPALFKGIGVKTMGNWGALAGKIAGPLVAAGLMIYDLLNAHKADDEIRRAEQRHHQAIQDAARDVIRDFRNSYRSNISKLVDSIFHPIEIWLDEQKSDKANQSATIKLDNLLLTQAKDELKNFGI